MQTVTVTVDSATAQINIHVYPSSSVSFSAPIVRITTLDEPAGFYTDALAACSAHVPRILGFGSDFRTRLLQLQHAPNPCCPTIGEAERMLNIYDYTVTRLLGDKFDGENPGHVLVALQCFSGVWSGVAAQCFALVLIAKCKAAAATRAGQAVSELVVALLLSIAKSFGSSIRIAPLVPRWPDGFGMPPDPVVLLVDALAARYPSELPFVCRNNLIDAFRAWHVPRCVRDTVKDWKKIWTPQRQYDRARAMMQMQINALTK